jgi:hypothetical protein
MAIGRANAPLCARLSGRLINLENFVPGRTGMLPQLLVGSRKTDEKQLALRMGQALEFWPLFAASTISIIGLFIGVAFMIPSGSSVVVQKALPLTATGETASTDDAARSDRTGPR